MHTQRYMHICIYIYTVYWPKRNKIEVQHKGVSLSSTIQKLSQSIRKSEEKMLLLGSSCQGEKTADDHAGPACFKLCTILINYTFFSIELGREVEPLDIN